jgi:hypothetical protein
MTRPQPPARTSDADPGQLPIAEVPSPALIFALGYATAKPAQAHRHYGGIAAIADELSRRWRTRPDSAIPITEFDALRMALPRRIAAGLEAMWRADRGQRMAGHRTNPPSSGK